MHKTLFRDKNLTIIISQVIISYVLYMYVYNIITLLLQNYHY